MGNAASDAAEDAAMARVEMLRDQLGDMERAVRHLSNRPQIDLLLPHQVRVHGLAVSTDSDVRVLLGPVIGKVDFQTARVLLEVDRATSVTCHVLIYDLRTDAFVEVPHCSVCVDATAARRPTVFRIQSLLSGRQYRVVFSGIHRDDASRKTGSFRTPTLAPTSSMNDDKMPQQPLIQCAVVSADDAYDIEYGEKPLWCELQRAVMDKPPRVELVLHLGGQVSMKRMFDKAYALLIRHAECMALPPTTCLTGSSGGDSNTFSRAWAKLEQEAMEILRSAYRTQWTLVDAKAAVLANASNLMMWSDWDVYPSFTTSAAFFVDHEHPTVEMQVLRTVVRCAKRLYQEYQRALWDDDVEDGCFPRDAELRKTAELALATTARISTLAKEIPSAQNELETQKKRRDIEGARKVERHLRALEAEKLKTEKMLVSYNQLLAPNAGEEFVHVVGPMGFLFLDLRSARVEAGGSQKAQNELLSNVQWAFIEQVLENDALQLLVLCTESPLVDDLPHELRGSSNGSSEWDFKTWWGCNANAQQRLLALVFEWKLLQEGRQVVVLSGACNTRFAAKTTVRDTRLRTDVTQWMAGPVSAHASGRVVPTWAGTLFDRYSFEHSDVDAQNKSFLSLSVANNSNSQVVHVARVDGTTVQRPACVLLGPVVGHVDAVSGVVLLEVDRNCDLVCVVHDTLTGARHRVFQQFQSHRPNSFFLHPLKPEHHYEITFERIQEPEKYNASFTTKPTMPSQLQLVVVNGVANDDSDIVVAALAAEPVENQHQHLSLSSLWPWIHENIASIVPFRCVDTVVHIEKGLLHGNSGQAEASLLMHLIEEEDKNEESNNMVKEKLRDLQRLQWNTPGVRQLLSRGSHLIVTGASQTTTQQDHNDPKQQILAECIDSVEREYENLLLPPSKRAASGEKRLTHPLHFVAGVFGTFVVPSELTTTTLAGDTAAAVASFWLRFQDFLKTPLLFVVVVVTATPILEDSIEDVQEKARFHSKYRDTLAFQQDKLKRLVELLMAWQQDQDDRLRGRRVVFVSGHQSRSFDSAIQQLAATSEMTPLPRSLWIPQFVIGPFFNQSSIQTQREKDAKSKSLELNVFPQGTLFDAYAYFHRFQRMATVEKSSASDPGKQNITSNGDDKTRSAGAVATSASTGGGGDSASFHQLFHLLLTLRPVVDDQEEVEIRPTYLVSTQSIQLTPTANAAGGGGGERSIMEQQEEKPRIVAVAGGENNNTTGTTQPPSEKWPLDTKQPPWLYKLVTQPLTAHEETTLGELKAALDDKHATIDVSFQRADQLSSGLVAAENHALFVGHLHAAIHDFHRHLAGISFRNAYPATPSAYEIDYTLRELSSPAKDSGSTTTGGDTTTTATASITGGTGQSMNTASIIGAIDGDQYQAILVKCLQNAWLFDSRLRAYWE